MVLPRRPYEFKINYFEDSSLKKKNRRGFAFECFDTKNDSIDPMD